MTERTLTYVPLDDLVPALTNPKRHSMEGIAASIGRAGFVEPMIRDVGHLPGAGSRRAHEGGHRRAAAPQGYAEPVIKTGRPSTIDQIVRIRDDGTEVTASQHLLERIALLGDDYVVACKSAGIAVPTLHNWRLKGSRAIAKAIRGEELVGDEPAYAEFVTALERAEADGEMRYLGIIERATQPFSLVKVTEKVDANNNVIERTTTTETRQGLWTAAAWRLERRYPDKYGRRMELTGPGGGPIPIEERARSLGEDLAAFQAGVAAQSDVSAEAAP